MFKQKPRIANWKEQQRFHALKLRGKNWKQSEIATALNVSKGEGRKSLICGHVLASKT